MLDATVSRDLIQGAEYWVPGEAQPFASHESARTPYVPAHYGDTVVSVHESTFPQSPFSTGPEQSAVAGGSSCTL